MDYTRDEHHPVTRRTLAKGAAWSVPVILATAAAPAVAASACRPTLRFSGGLFYDFGTIYNSGTNTTNQYLTLGGQTYVDNLPSGVTVARIDYTFWVENRQGQDSSGPGAFWLGNNTASTKGSCSSTTCSLTWAPTAGSGFSKTVTNTKNNFSLTYPNGESVPSWDLNMSWTPNANTGKAYTPTPEGCRNFDSGPSGRFRVDYTGVRALTLQDVRDGKKTIRSYSEVVVTLSDGTVLKETYLVKYTN